MSDVDDIDDIGDIAGLVTGLFDEKPALPPRKTPGQIVKQMKVKGHAETLEIRLQENRELEVQVQELSRMDAEEEEENERLAKKKEQEQENGKARAIRLAQARKFEATQNLQLDDEVVAQRSRDLFSEYKLTKDVEVDIFLGDAIEMGENEKAKGNRLFQKGDFVAASDAYERGLKLFDGTELLQMPMEAKRLCAALCCNNAQSWLKQAECIPAAFSEHLSLIKTAREMADRALKYDPTNIKALFRRGCAYTKSEDWNLACDDFELALRLDPANEAVQIEMYNIKDKISDERWAMKESAAIEVGEAAKSEGNTLFHNGHYYAAYEAYLQGLRYLEEIDINRMGDKSRKLTVALYSNAAHALLKCHDDTNNSAMDARELLNKALALDSNNVKALFRRGCSYAFIGNFDRAYLDFKQALHLDPDNRAVEKEMVLLKAKRAQLAKESQDKDEQKESEEDDADGCPPSACSKQSHRNALEQIMEKAVAAKTQGNSLFKKEQFHAANKAYQEGLQAFSRLKPFMLSAKAREVNVALYCNAAQALLRCGSDEGADSVGAMYMADRALSLDSGNVKALFRRACARMNAGEWDRAKADLQALLEIDPGNEEAQCQLDDLPEKMRIANENRTAKPMSWIERTSIDDLIDDAVVKQDEGHRLFHQARYREACETYEIGYRTLERIKTDIEPKVYVVRAELMCSAAQAQLEYAVSDGCEHALIKAREFATMAIEMSHENPKAFLRRGLANARLMNCEEAASNDFKEAIRIDPACDAAHDELQVIRERSWANATWFKVVFNKKVVLRSEPHRQSCPVESLNPGEVVEMAEVRGSWARLADSEAQKRAITVETDAWVLLDGTRYGTGLLLEACEAPEEWATAQRNYKGSLRDAREAKRLVQEDSRRREARRMAAQARSASST